MNARVALLTIATFDLAHGVLSKATLGGTTT